AQREERPSGDILIEVLETVRTMSRSISDDITPRLERLTHQAIGVPLNTNVTATPISMSPASSTSNAAARPIKVSHINSIEKSIEFILTDKQDMKGTDILDFFEPQIHKQVVAAMRSMKQRGVVEYREPLSTGFSIR